MPISEKHLRYGADIKNEFNKVNIRSEVDEGNNTIGYKIRTATLQKIPYLIIIGDKEITKKQVSVRTREGKDLGLIDLSNFIESLKEKIEKYV